MRWILILCFNVMTLAFAGALWGELRELSWQRAPYPAVWLGTLAFVGFAQLPWPFVRENLEHFRVKIHEEIHEKMSLLFLRTIKGFYAHPQGGELHFSGRENFVILLAPYCLPIYALLILLIRPLILPEYYPPVYFLLGFAWMLHLSTFFQQMGGHQSDITRYGRLFSYSFILWLNLLDRAHSGQPARRLVGEWVLSPGRLVILVLVPLFWWERLNQGATLTQMAP